MAYGKESRNQVLYCHFRRLGASASVPCILCSWEPFSSQYVLAVVLSSPPFLLLAVFRTPIQFLPVQMLSALFPPFCFVVLDICSTDGVSSSWSDSCYIYPSPEDDKPPPYSCYPSFHHFHSKISPSSRLEPPLPLYRWSGYSQTLPPASSSSSSSSPSPQQLDINSNPKPYFLHLPKQSSLTEMHGPETNLSSIHMKTSLTLSKPDPPGTLYSSHMSVSPPWASCTCARDRGAGLTR